MSLSVSTRSNIYIQIVAIIEKNFLRGKGCTDGQTDSETGFIMMTQRTQILLTTRINSTTVTTPFQHRIYNFPTYNIIVRAAIEFFWRLESSTRTNTLTITSSTP